MIMDDVMYGVMFNANNDMFSNEPPVKALKNPIASSESNEPKICEITLESVPGIGIWQPILTTTNNASVYNNFCLTSFTFNAF